MRIHTVFNGVVEMSEEIPLEIDGIIKCPRMGCDGFLDTLAPIPYTHMCVSCYAKYSLSLVDNYDGDEEDEVVA